MEDEVKKAVDSAIASNRLEGYILTEEEKKKVIDSINTPDNAFTDSVMEEIDEEKKKGENGNVKVRK